MGESELSITYDELLQEVAIYLGYGPDSTAWSSAQTAECDRYVQSGVRRFYYPPAVEGVEAGYQWSFMHPTSSLATTASDAAQDLPENLARVIGPFHYDDQEHRRSIVQVSEERYQALLARDDDNGPPQVCRVRHKEQTEGFGQRYEVAWWPIPDAAYTLAYQYEAYSGKLSATNPYPLGGMRYAELVVQSCLAVAEKKANDEVGIHQRDFERLLASSVQQDRRLGARFFGHMGDFNHGDFTVPRRGETGASHTITYNGVNTDNL